MAAGRERKSEEWREHQSMRERLKLAWQRRLRVTREGKFFLAITIGIGFTAVNTANNLLYLVLGLLMSLIVISSIMSELSLRNLTIVRRLPLRAQVGKPHLVEVEVYNHKARIPSYAIEVEDLRLGQPADKRCFFLKISPNSAQVAAYRRTPTTRGIDVHSGFRLATRFPFGIFEKSREVTAAGELIIYPAVDAISPATLRGSTNDDALGSVERGFGDELVGLRPMRDGEDPRDIHWRKSAAAGQPVLKERGELRHREIILRLDTQEINIPGWKDAFERTIRAVASRAVAHIKRGDSVAVRTTAGPAIRASKRTGADPLLRFLALIEPTTARTELPAPSKDPI